MTQTPTPLRNQMRDLSRTMQTGILTRMHRRHQIPANLRRSVSVTMTAVTERSAGRIGVRHVAHVTAIAFTASHVTTVTVTTNIVTGSEPVHT